MSWKRLVTNAANPIETFLNSRWPISGPGVEAVVDQLTTIPGSEVSLKLEIDSNGIRHAMLEEPELTPADARYFLLSCTSFVNYLKAQIPRHGVPRVGGQGVHSSPVIWIERGLSSRVLAGRSPLRLRLSVSGTNMKRRQARKNRIESFRRLLS